MTRLFEFVTRAKCSTCGMLWTTPGSGNVTCPCGDVSIVDDMIVGRSAAFTDQEFDRACGDEVNIAVTDVLTLDRG